MFYLLTFERFLCYDKELFFLRKLMKAKNGYDHSDLLNALSLYIHQQFLTYFGQPKLDLNYIKNRYLRDILSLGYYNQRN